MSRLDRDPTRPVYVISVAASIVSAHPRTLRIYEDEGLLCPARTATNIRLYSEEDVRRILWIRHLTQNRGVNLAGIRVLFELEERLGMRILETLFDEDNAQADRDNAQAEARAGGDPSGMPATSEPTQARASTGQPAQATGPNQATGRNQAAQPSRAGEPMTDRTSSQDQGASPLPGRTSHRRP